MVPIYRKYTKFIIENFDNNILVAIMDFKNLKPHLQDEKRKLDLKKIEKKLVDHRFPHIGIETHHTTIINVSIVLIEKC